MNTCEAPQLIDTILPIKVLQGNAQNLTRLSKHFPVKGFDVVLTSPPYWQRRDYGHPDQLGQEATPALFVRNLTKTVHKWAKYLAPHASVFINLADTYADGYLAGIPTLFEIEMIRRGWQLAHRIIWSKTTSVPQPLATRLASRHEVVFHFVPPKSKGYYFDRFALAEYCQGAEIGDVWHLATSRSKSGHPAPFPSELVNRILRLSCPERCCIECGQPYVRQTAPTTMLDLSRPQAIKAMERFEAAGLTEDHIAAIRAIGISDAGMGKKLQRGSGRNNIYKQKLADEAKAALGGYFREFTFAPREHIGWKRCSCEVPTQPGCVLDPFAGSNTTLLTAHELGFHAIGVDLTPHSL